MPIYEYQCDSCGKVDEVLQKINEKPLTECRHCSGKLHKLISQSAFHLKGTGWYVTDYAGKSQNPKKESGENTTADNASSGKATTTDSKKASSDE